MANDNLEYKIVVVDDEKGICNTIKSILEISNYIVEIFYDAGSAYDYLVACQEKLPDIIITDYQLKGENGIELLAKIKSNYPEISVIIITGYGDKKLAVESMKLGAEDFIDKPLTAHNIRNAVERILIKRDANLKIHSQKSDAIIHEINNHLTIMKTSAQLLKIEGNSNFEVSEIINKQIDLIDGTIKTMLAPENFIKSSIKLHKEKIDLKKLIENVVVLLENNASDKNIKIQTELIDINVLADINYIRQVIMNIILNSIIYSSENTNIKISVKNEHKFIFIEITDEGIGIPDNFKDKIFQYGFRINPEIKGCGIGLFFARNVLNAHNGRIEVIDNYPCGSVFRIILNG